MTLTADPAAYEAGGLFLIVLALNVYGWWLSTFFGRWSRWLLRAVGIYVLALVLLELP